MNAEIELQKKLNTGEKQSEFLATCSKEIVADRRINFCELSRLGEK